MSSIQSITLMIGGTYTIIFLIFGTIIYFKLRANNALVKEMEGRLNEGARVSWSTKEWLAEAEHIMDTHVDPLALLLPGHLVALHTTVIELRQQLKKLMLTEAYQIRELGVGAVLRDDNGLILEKQEDGDGSAAYWTAPGNSDEMFSPETIVLPATLLFRYP